MDILFKVSCRVFYDLITMSWFIFHSLWYCMVYPYPHQHRSTLLLEQNLNCSLKKYTHIHPDLSYWLHVIPCFLDILTFFLNYSYRILNRHELWNIHQGRTTSENTAYTRHINKRETKIYTKKPWSSSWWTNFLPYIFTVNLH